MEHAGGRLPNAETDVGTDVEHGNFDWTDLALDPVEQGSGFFFRAGIGAEGMGSAAFLADFGAERFELIQMARAAGDADSQARTREGSCNRAAKPFASADNEAHALCRWFAHASPLPCDCGLRTAPGMQIAIAGVDGRC